MIHIIHIHIYDLIYLALSCRLKPPQSLLVLSQLPMTMYRKKKKWMFCQKVLFNSLIFLKGEFYLI